VKTWKTFWWFALAGGVGGSLTFIVLCIQFQPPGRNEIFIYLWPLFTSSLSIVACRCLRRSYRLEPAQHAGLWQLSIRDLLAVTLFAASLLAVFQRLWPIEFVYVGVPCALISTALCVAGLLVAARKGIESGVRRYGFAVGFVMRLYGALGVGTFVVLFVVILLLGNSGSVVRFCGGIFGSQRIPSADKVFVYPIRAGLACLLPGLLLCHLAQRKKSAEGSP
jgi:hypothetical protein